MNKPAVIAVTLATILLVALFPATQTAQSSDYLRIHIRANSNSAADQSVKYKVKAAVVDELTPVLADCRTKADAQKAVKARLPELSAAAESALAAAGMRYKAKASLRSEDFPARDYAGLTLPQGAYDALIIELGDARGDNWWCVVYPPLCFVGAENTGAEGIVYKSKLLEIIEEFKRSKGG